MPPPATLLQDWRAVAAAGVTAVTITVLTPLFAPGLTRHDPFTGTNAVIMRKEIDDRIQNELVLLRAELALQLPPEATRIRIEALEEAVREFNPEYRPPTRRFSSYYPLQVGKPVETFDAH